MRTAAECWALPNIYSGTGPPLTLDEVRQNEREQGVAFPDLLVEMLTYQSHGGLYGTNWKLEGRGMGYEAEVPWRIRPVYAAAQGDDYIEQLGLTGDLDLLLGFDARNGHDVLCLDYRADGPDHEPAVTLLDTEGRSCEPLSADFESYMSELVSPHEGAVFVSVDAQRTDLEDFLVHRFAGLPMDRRVDETRIGDWNHGAVLYVNECEGLTDYYRRPLRIPEDPQVGWIVESMPRDAMDRIDAELAGALRLELAGAGFDIRPQPFESQPVRG